MRYVGIGCRKRYILRGAPDERGRAIREERINTNSETGFAQFFASLGEPSAVVM
jgi:hypothetical protein